MAPSVLRTACYTCSADDVVTPAVKGRRIMQDIRIAGATGPCTSANNKSPLASEVELGAGGTSSWKLCTLTQSTSLGMFFEVAASHGTVLEPGQILCLQFQTQYQHPSGQHRLRVVTVARPWAEPNAAEVGNNHAHLRVAYPHHVVMRDRDSPSASGQGYC